jgi:glycosyltransferase involved in cell wall biosynthesis
MRINYFSPLLPAQSGISEVAEQTIPALSRYADVTVWTDQTQWSQELERSATIRQYNPATVTWQELQQADLNVYHLGNNVQFHHSIWQVSRLVPGLVVLHDPKLQHLFFGMRCTRNQDHEGYIREISRWYGPEAGVTARRFLGQELPIAAVEDFAMTEWALGPAAAVLVHTQTALGELRAMDRWPIGYHPLPFHAPPLLRSRPVAAPPYRLVVFGYIAYNRRVEAVLEALAGLPERHQFQLDIYGKLDEAAQIEQAIAQFDLTAQVTVHGFVEDAVLDAALATAHLAINLRYPTMGEASISQLRIWRHALPALVTQVGWYAEQPDDVVCFVRPEQEVADIQQHLRDLIAQPDRFTAIGQRGRQRLETHHAPDAYAQAIVAFAHQLKPGNPHLTTQYLVERSASILNRWQSSDLGDRELNRLSAAISWLSQTV